MGRQLGLGAAVGLVVALMCWRGNQTPHLISTFPDLITLIVLAVLLNAAVRFDLRRRAGRDRAMALRAGLTIAAACGAMAAMSLWEFRTPRTIQNQAKLR